MDPKTIKKRVLAAADLLTSPTLPKQKVDDLTTLLSGISLTLNGEPLLGRVTTIHLGSSKIHDLRISCQ